MITLKSRSDFTIDNYREVAWRNRPVRFHECAITRMRTARAGFLHLLDSDPGITIYGVTTGYGQHASINLDRQQRKTHARRPPRHIAAGFGGELPNRVARGIAFARLVNFVEGHAAITPELAVAVAALLDREAVPAMPLRGNTSAGEILPLAHLLAGIAEDTELGEKDALALVNGSPCATALAADVALAAVLRLELAIDVFALSIEAMKAPLDAYDEALAECWCDPHETAVLGDLGRRLDGAGPDRRAYQAPVSWRILPRVLGQARRAAHQALQVAQGSLRAVTDNPVFIAPDEPHHLGRVLSNGGYHNAAAYPAIDQVAASWADLALLADRQVSKLLDGNVSLLPPQLMVNDAYIGCLAFTAADYAETARGTATRTLLPGSEGGGFGQNDISVPTFAAWRKERRAGECLDACLAILAAVASQALHVTGRAAPPPLEAFLAQVRGLFPPVAESRVLGPDAATLSAQFTARVFDNALSDFGRPNT